MINFTLRKFIKNLKGVSLSDDERAFLRKDFLTRTDLPGLSQQEIRKQPWVESLFIFQSYRAMVAACFMLVLSGGAVVFVANHSLPGDVLYPLKTNVNEAVVRAFHETSSASTADYEVDLVNERLVEAEKLNQDSPLTLDQKTVLKTQVMAQTARAKMAISVIATSSPDTQPEHGRLESIFKTHQRIFQELNATSTTVSFYLIKNIH